MPIQSRGDIERLMEDIAIWNKYHSLRGILGRRLTLLTEYLIATNQLKGKETK